MPFYHQFTLRPLLVPFDYLGPVTLALFPEVLRFLMNFPQVKSPTLSDWNMTTTAMQTRMAPTVTNKTRELISYAQKVCVCVWGGSASMIRLVQI